MSIHVYVSKLKKNKNKIKSIIINDYSHYIYTHI